MSASQETLVKQAGWTAGIYLASAIVEIDKIFGKNYAKKNPQLVGSFIQTAALDYRATHLAQEICNEIRQRE